VRSRVRQVFVMLVLVMVLGAWIAAVPAMAEAGSAASAPGGGPKASDSSLVTPSDIPNSECIGSSWGVPYVIAGDSVQVTATITTAATQSGTTCTQSSTPITSGTITIQVLSNSCAGAVIASASYPLNGTNSVTESLSTGAGSSLPAGTYAFSSTYDAGNGPTSPSCGTLPVYQATPSITQTAQDVPLGAGTQDTAKVTGGDSPTGTVTMGLYSNSGCTSLVYSNTQSLSGGAATSASYTPTKAGTYYWSATYTGDTNNTSASSGCEAVNVTASPTTTTTTTTTTPTTQTVPATVKLSLSSSKVTAGTNANATIGVSGPAGFAPGTLYVRIYASPTCDAAQVAVASNAINETTGVQDSFGTGTGGLKAGQYGVQAAYKGGTGGVEATGSSACVPLTVVLPAAANGCPAQNPHPKGLSLAPSGIELPAGASAEIHATVGLVVRPLSRQKVTFKVCGQNPGQEKSEKTVAHPQSGSGVPRVYFTDTDRNGPGTDLISATTKVFGKTVTATASIVWERPIDCAKVGKGFVVAFQCAYAANFEKKIKPLLESVYETGECALEVGLFFVPEAKFAELANAFRDASAARFSEVVGKDVALSSPAGKLILDLEKFRNGGKISVKLIYDLFDDVHSLPGFLQAITNLVGASDTRTAATIVGDVTQLAGVEPCIDLAAKAWHIVKPHVIGEDMIAGRGGLGLNTPAGSNELTLRSLRLSLTHA
jgi:hypothetical protein